MIRTAFIAAAMLSITTGTLAAPCKDPKTGRFIKCPPPSSTGPTAGTRCKDTKGKFAKCGTPGATPIATAKK